MSQEKIKISKPEDNGNEEITINMPQTQIAGTVKIKHWYFEQDETNIIDPDDMLLRIETDSNFIDIKVPSTITTSCRVKTLYKQQGEAIHPGEKLITLIPLKNV